MYVSYSYSPSCQSATNLWQQVYGLGADRVVEFQIVTPDGVSRTASAFASDDGTAAKTAFQKQTDFAVGGTSTIVVGESFGAIWDQYIQPNPAEAPERRPGRLRLEPAAPHGQVRDAQGAGRYPYLHAARAAARLRPQDYVHARDDAVYVQRQCPLR